MIAGLLLAAGRSSRFGSDKLLAPLRGHPVLFWSAAALATEVEALYVVMPPESGERRAAVRGVAAEIVEHPDRDAGLASSLRAGIAALPDTVEAVVIGLADQPLVSSAVVRALCERWYRERVDAVAPRYRDGPGHPVLFDRAMFAELSSLSGDRGARELLRDLGDRLAVVRVDDEIPVDVDTPEALRALAALWREG